MKGIYVNKLVRMDVDDLEKVDENWMFYDWFEEDHRKLKAKAKKLLAFLKRLAAKADPRMLMTTECTAFFQECCSGAWGCYPVVKICDCGGGGVRYCVCPSDSRAKGLPTVAYFNPEVDRFENPLVFESRGDVAAWFADPGRFRVYDSVPRERGGESLAMCVLRDEFAKKRKGGRK